MNNSNQSKKRRTLQSILARVVALENKPDNTAQITALNNELDALESTVSLLTARITTLENAEPVTPVIPIDMLSAYATLQAPYIKITTHAPQAMTVCYEVTFHINNPEEVGAPGDTLDDVMVLLYTDSPVEIKAGSVELIPQFKLMYNADDTQWLLYQVCFTTQGTSVPLGTSVKDITVLVNEVGDFITVKVMPIAATGTTPSW